MPWIEVVYNEQGQSRLKQLRPIGLASERGAYIWVLRGFAQWGDFLVQYNVGGLDDLVQNPVRVAIKYNLASSESLDPNTSTGSTFENRHWH